MSKKKCDCGEKIQKLEERVARLEKIAKDRIEAERVDTLTNEAHGIILLDDRSVDMRKYIAIILKSRQKHVPWGN